MEILNIQNITKYFNNNIANNNISFTIQKGTIFGLIGPNGAGKTTLLRIICNILIPDSGKITLFGQPINNILQNRIGYLPEERGLYKKLKVLEHLIYFGRLKGMSNKEARNSAMKWLEKLEAEKWINKKIKELSKGMQQKIQFIIALINSPDFIILDEPFSGLDPVNMELLKNIILEQRSLGKTFILSTHIMAHTEELCNSVCMLNKGKVILNGSILDIKKSYSKNIIILEFEEINDFDINNYFNINYYEDIEIINTIKNRITLKVKNNNFNKRNFIEQINRNLNITKFVIEAPSLHEIFIDKCNNKIDLININ